MVAVLRTWGGSSERRRKESGGAFLGGSVSRGESHRPERADGGVRRWIRLTIPPRRRADKSRAPANAAHTGATRPARSARSARRSPERPRSRRDPVVTGQLAGRTSEFAPAASFTSSRRRPASAPAGDTLHAAPRSIFAVQPAPSYRSVEHSDLQPPGPANAPAGFDRIASPRPATILLRGGRRSHK